MFWGARCFAIATDLALCFLSEIGFDDNYIQSPRKDDGMRSEHERFNELALGILYERQEMQE